VKPGLALVLLGLLALFAQGVVSSWLPPRYLPDLPLLMVVAAALGVRSTAGGLLFAAGMGYATDCLSSALLGQHMLLAMAAFAAVRVSAARLNLRGPLPLLIFMTALSAAHAAGLWLLIAFFRGGAAPPPSDLVDALPHALICGLAAPFVVGGVVALLNWLADDEGQRPLRLEHGALSS